MNTDEHWATARLGDSVTGPLAMYEDKVDADRCGYCGLPLHQKTAEKIRTITKKRKDKA